MKIQILENYAHAEFYIPIIISSINTENDKLFHNNLPQTWYSVWLYINPQICFVW